MIIDQSIINKVHFQKDFRHKAFDLLGLSYGFISKSKSISLSHSSLKTTDLPSEPDILRPKQIHSDVTVHVSKVLENPYTEADAIYTEGEETIGVVTADCIPLLVSDSEARFLLAIHAGWRGAVSALIPKSLDLVYTSNAIPLSEVYVLIEPSILPDRYEVRSDVVDLVRSCIGDERMALCIREQSANSYLLDLQVLACIRLILAGVPPTNISVSRVCTFDTPDFHSFRRDKDKRGRNFSFITKRKI